MTIFKVMKKHFSLLVFVFITACYTAHSQKFIFSTIGREEGLPHSNVTSIIQDDIGFMWFGTQDGLTRYDGYNLKVFRPDPSNGKAIYDSWITNLFLDNLGRIWCHFNSGGVSIYDPNDESFTTLLSNPSDPTTLSSNLLSGDVNFNGVLAQEKKGDIWLATSNGLNRINPSTLKATRFYKGLEIDGGLTGSNVITLFLDEKYNLLWIGTTEGLTRLNLLTNAVRHYTMETGLSDNNIKTITRGVDGALWLGGRRSGLMRCELDESQNITSVKTFLNKENLAYIERSNNVHRIFVAKNGDIWTGTDHGIYRLKPDGSNLKGYAISGSGQNFVSNIIKGNKNDIWFAGASSDYGLMRYQYDNDILTEYNQKDEEYHGLTSNYIKNIYLDNSGVLWIGTTKSGLIRNNLFNKNFESFSERELNAVTNEGDEVYSIYVAASGEKFIGTKTALNVLDSNNVVFRKFSLGETSASLKWNLPGVINPVLGNNDSYWVGFFEGKVSLYHTNTNTFRNYDGTGGLANFPAWSLRGIINSSDSTTYFATITGGLLYKNYGENKFIKLSDLFPQQKLVSEPVFSITEDSKKRIWIGTNNSGIIIYNPSRETFKYISADDSEGSLSHNEVRVFHEDSKGLMWVGTRLGLNCIDSEDNIIAKYSNQNGLPSNIIHGILEDQEGNIWCSTNMGLSKMVRTEDQIRFINYLKEDGIQGNEFNEGAYFKSGDGTMYFGGATGFTKFNPEQVESDNTKPKVVLTGLFVNQKEIVPDSNFRAHNILKSAISNAEVIKLPYSLNNFSVTFSTLDFRIPEKNRYRYRMLDIESNWVESELGDYMATYGWLPPNNYLFQVQASNLDGTWSSDIREVRIIIVPPWWKSLWFKILVGILISIIIVGGFLWNMKILRLRKKTLEETVKNRTEDLMVANNELEVQKEKILMQNQNLHEHQQELEQQQKNISLLSEMGQKITSSVELADVFVQIFQTINELMDIKELMVGTVNSSHNSLEIWGVNSEHERFTHNDISLDVDNRLSVFVTKNNQPVVSNNLPKTSKELLKNPDEKYLAHDSTKSGIYLPLIGARGAVKGVLVALASDYDAYNSKHVNILNGLATYISIALDNANAYARIKMQSQQLVQVDKIKTDFYTNVSHEFRTPLSLIQAPVQELMKSGKKSSEEIKLLTIINRNSKLLLNLVEQIMELSKIDGDAMKVNTKESCISDQFKSIGESFRQLALQKSILFVVNQPDETVRAVYDYDILNKICYNLINNAIKYTQDGGQVTFTVSYLGKGVLLTIADNGFGIPKEDLNYVFDRYYRSVSSEYQESGAGIGLALVRQLIEMIGANIEVSSKYHVDHPGNSGTVFKAFIPLENIEKITDPAFIKNPIEVDSALVSPKIKNQRKLINKADNLLKATILLVEDNEDLRDFVYNKLSDKYAVITAANGSEALEKIENNQPHLIISDVMMPIMNGIKLCKQLKSNLNTSHIPIILLTAKDAIEDQTEGLAAGATDYIVKPFNVDQLFLKVNNILANRLELIKQFKENVWTGIEDYSEEVNPQDQKFLASIKQILEDNIDDTNLSIEFFCSELGVSRTWLYNKMKALLDMTMHEFITVCRLKHGAKLLINDRISIAEAAYAVGFNDPKYFGRCFKKEFGMGPREYVKSKLQVFN